MKISIITLLFLFTFSLSEKYTKSPIMIGYYQTWNDAGNPFIKLRDVDSNWDVIEVAFAVPKVPGSTNGRMVFSIDGLSSDYTEDDFKEDIKKLQKEGKKVVLSIGGYTGYFSLDSTTAIVTFTDGISEIIDEYGFDGIDIDLEQSSLEFEQGKDPDIREIKSPKIANMVKAIKTLCEKYGEDFILTWAPETMYMQMGYTIYAGITPYVPSAGSYLPMIHALRKETTFVHVQYYNTGSMDSPDGKVYSMGTKDGIVAMCKMLLEGFYVDQGQGVEKSDKTYFAPLSPGQVAIGVPASKGAAGSGQISNSELQKAFAELEEAYPGIRGIMSWSINWDNTQNKNSFVDENAKFLAKYRK